MSKGQIISDRDLKKYLFQWKIPNKLRPLIVKELLMLNLISREGQYLLKINRPIYNEEDINDYYDLLGLFKLDNDKKHL